MDFKFYWVFLLLFLFAHSAWSYDDVSGGYFEQEVYCPHATSSVERENYYSTLDVLSPRQEQPKESDYRRGGGDQDAVQ